jgi:hypothetical protein
VKPLHTPSYPNLLRVTMMPGHSNVLIEFEQGQGTLAVRRSTPWSVFRSSLGTLNIVSLKNPHPPVDATIPLRPSETFSMTRASCQREHCRRSQQKTRGFQLRDCPPDPRQWAPTSKPSLQ